MLAGWSNIEIPAMSQNPLTLSTISLMTSDSLAFILETRLGKR